jgi:hypothetical protein
MTCRESALTVNALDARGVKRLDPVGECRAWRPVRAARCAGAPLDRSVVVAAACLVENSPLRTVGQSLRVLCHIVARVIA